MKFVSEQFKNILNEQIRPATRLYFEIGSNVSDLVGGNFEHSNIGLDDDFAPTAYSDGTNEYYYAVIGDERGVDDPNRICPPTKVDGEFPAPTHTIPYGVTPYTAANTEVLIGNSTVFYNNFIGFNAPVLISFKGHIPDVIRVEIFDDDLETWSTETTITNEDLNEEILFTPSDYSLGGKFRRFWVKNTTEDGRFQFNWIIREWESEAPAVFEDSHIASCNISMETDLTSQALPSYEMTVECLDVDEEYTPDTEYWEDQFKEGTKCYFKVGYEIDGITEYIPFFFGKLSKAPTYSAGKITFNVAFDWSNRWNVDLYSIPNKNLNTGDIVDGVTFFDIMDYRSDLFTHYDVFRDQTDIDNSVCNYFGSIPFGEARQLIANALGCYITVGLGSVDLHNSNDIQYKSYEDYVTRWEQIQNTLDSQPKVGKISVTRNENRLSSNSVQRSLAERFYVHAGENEWATYNIPFYAVGKFVVNNYNKSVPSAAVQANYEYTASEDIKPDGTVDIELEFWSDTNTYLQPVVTFYGVDNAQFQETEIISDDKRGEEYINTNDLVTNSYISGKVMRVAHLINDVSNQYEIDVVQDYRYELGDVVRLETETNKFKTCVVTGLNFALPGSSGHITCRKIFSMLDCPQAVIDPNGLTVTSVDTTHQEFTLTVKETSENGVIVAYMPKSTTIVYGTNVVFILGASKIHYSSGGYEYDVGNTKYLTDLNGHNWSYIAFSVGDGETVDTTAPVVQLPAYDETKTNSDLAFGLVNLIRHIYETQGMTAPVDYTCETHNVVT